MPTPPTDPPLVWLIAGEPSGDLIGARLIAALRDATGGRIRIAGIGGEAMQGEGLETLFPISDIAVMGVVEIVHKIPLIKRRVRETVARIARDRPDIVVSIDVPEFSSDIWKKLQGEGIPLVHYVAPTVWAWRPRRAKAFAAYLDHLLALLPFEPPFFEREGLACTFVGHPVLQGGADGGDGAAFRQRYDVAADGKLVAVLPGSRRGEIAKLVPVFRDAASRVCLRHPDCVFVFPTVGYLEDFLRDRISGWPGRVLVVNTIGEKFDAMAASDVAMAASGTVSLELAMAKVPHVIAYRLNPLTIAVVKRLQGIRQRFANLVNILLDREAIPELLQDRCRGDLVASEVLRLLDDEADCAAQHEAMGEALAMLRPPEGEPSELAASVVLSYLDGKTKDRVRRAEEDGTKWRPI